MKNDMKLQGKVVFVIGLFVICLFLQACNKVNCPGWMIAYRSTVENWQSIYGEDALGYELIYLDNDDIPELMLYCNDGAWEGFDIYTYYNEKPVHLDKYNMQGESEMTEENFLTSNGHQGKEDSYINRSGILFQRGGMMGSYWVSAYILEHGKLKQILNYSYIDCTDWDEDAPPISYEFQYMKRDGSIVEQCKQEDVNFVDCIELIDFENEYDFDYREGQAVPTNSIISYDEIMDCLKGKMSQWK